MYSTVTEPESYSVNKIGIEEAIPNDECKVPIKTKDDGKTNPLQCGICGLIICNKWNLTLHMRIHNNDRRYKCDQCSASFIIAHDLKKHSLAHAGVKPAFKCRFCPKTYTSRHHRYLHEDTHDKKLQYKCRHCPEIFSKFLLRKIHERESHVKDGIFFNCSHCSKKFTSRSFLETHEKNFHKKEDGGFCCHECGQFFETSITLNIHRRVHTFKTVVIGKDDESGNEKNEIVIIKKNSTEIGDTRFHECIICLERYTSRSNMMTHMLNTHPVETKAIFKFSCSQCDKLFKKKQELTQHLVTHEGEKKYCCILCNYKSKRNTDLKVHMRKHKDGISHVCEICGQRFYEVRLFQQHKKLHIKKDFKAFKCDICSMSFYRRKCWEAHVDKHKNGGFQCESCGKFYTNPYNLKKHLRSGKCEENVNLSEPINISINNCDLSVQTIEKRYECFACGFSTCSELTMSQHETSHNITDVCDKINVRIDTGAAFEAKRKTESNLLLKVLKSSPDNSDYKDVSLPSSSNIIANPTFTPLEDPISFSDDNIFYTHLCPSSMIETLKSSIVEIDGKKYLDLDEIAKLRNIESLTPCLENLLKIL